MKKQISILLTFVIFLSFSVYGLVIEETLIEDRLFQDLSIEETINIKIINNSQDYFLFNLPKDAYKISINDKQISTNNNSLRIPLECEICRLKISYSLDDVIKAYKDEFTFSRTLNFPKTPKFLSYETYIPVGYIIGLQTNEPDPSIVPSASKIKTDGKNIIIVWSENNPQLPKRYFIKYYEQELTETPFQEFKGELSEWAIWVIILFSLIIGIGVGFISNQYYNRKYNEKDLPYIPLSLLSPDEKTVLKLLKKNRSKMNQKEIGKDLHWSKSKVSAIMSNLEYKEIIKREKIGRNYKVEVIKVIERE